jgi:hypothetical protein
VPYRLKTPMEVVSEVEALTGLPVVEVVRNKNYAWTAVGKVGGRGMRLCLPERYGPVEFCPVCTKDLESDGFCFECRELRIVGGVG